MNARVQIASSLELPASIASCHRPSYSSFWARGLCAGSRAQFSAVVGNMYAVSLPRMAVVATLSHIPCHGAGRVFPTEVIYQQIDREPQETAKIRGWVWICPPSVYQNLGQVRRDVGLFNSPQWVPQAIARDQGRMGKLAWWMWDRPGN